MSVNIFESAYYCFIENDAENKVKLTYLAFEKMQKEQLTDTTQRLEYRENNAPGHPSKPRLVSPKQVPRRSLNTLEGQAALIHAICHIEFNAINLAWDIILRFQDMPLAFYGDWYQVAYEEARHFSMLSKCLEKRDYAYGDFIAHNGLWDAAMQTTDDVLRRLAIVPRVHEAHGLDVTPDILSKIQNHDDMYDVVEALELILAEEVGHVKMGTKWFNYVCEERGLDKLETFSRLIDEFNIKQRTKKLNIAARMAAGFSKAELELLQ